jgi:hypothetical protein
MRKVLYRKWIPFNWVKRPGENSNMIEPGTGCWENNFTHEGLFHQWVNAYENFESGAGNYTVGLVELPDGTIEEVLPTNIKFNDKIEIN